MRQDESGKTIELSPDEKSVETLKEIQNQFGSITYGKGAAIVRMMIGFMGQKVFDAGIRNFIRNYKYQTVDQDQLFYELQKAVDNAGILLRSPIKTIMDTWTKNKGYPIITFHRDEKNPNLVTISQKSNERNSKALWWIPITYQSVYNGTMSNIYQTLWLNPDQNRQQNFTLDSEILPEAAIVVNGYRQGYFRVNYDAENWTKLNGIANQLPNQVRLGIRSDIYALTDEVPEKAPIFNLIRSVSPIG